MDWLTRLFLLLTVGVLTFGLYQLYPSDPTSKQQFKQSVETNRTKHATDEDSSVRELKPSLRERAEEIGFKSTSVDTDVLDREWSTFDEQPIRLTGHGSRWILLNFWASWCSPCREEMPSLERLQESFDPERLQVVAANVRESRDEAGAFVEEQDLTLPVLMDSDGKLSEAFGVKGLPVTWILTPGGNPLMRLRGSLQWDRRKVVGLLRQLTARD